MPKIPIVLTCPEMEHFLQRTSSSPSGSLTPNLTLCPPHAIGVLSQVGG